ncbi:MAG TPA: type II CAAX endopeptidase family protein [Thermoanaerobaculia bacterium]|jgi:membrane protease YdiL (CAAX protease family)|nr:type II CAAX endopeptidase family protein [Thermoanaerobaculia bacterium]
MFCPQCGSEYREGFYRCVDCEADLVGELPPRPEPAALAALATVVATGDRALLARAKLLLGDAGIPYLIRGEGPHDLLAQGLLGPGVRVGPMEIQVDSWWWRKAEALLRQGEIEPVEATPEEQSAGEEEEPERPTVSRPLSDHRLRAWELALVLLVAFSSPLLSSALDWWTGRLGPGTPTVLDSLYGINKQAVCVALLAYVLSRRGQSWRDLGLTFHWTDIPVGYFLLLAARLAHFLAWRVTSWGSALITGHKIAITPGPEPIAGLALITLSLVLAVIDPIYEELIVRAFTMTEVEALTGSTGLAIAASVVLQTSYHLYLGTASALAAGATFLVYAGFYARFRRITPVIFSHVVWDLMVTLRHL